ncbi:hypothetical protein FA95DRAFT_589081 [Auriscalpium vulgare]|uniref:Uncharacterized protein n=1 Tax=Auriscalpium vulgare TaxID=40419 RepID=A0ACB8RF96_9AGAM|nr:hypothetical protein FA95DRAFT_589081 [Auriscalpium vulgare]
MGGRRTVGISCINSVKTLVLACFLSVFSASLTYYPTGHCQILPESSQSPIRSRPSDRIYADGLPQTSLYYILVQNCSLPADETPNSASLCTSAVDWCFPSLKLCPFLAGH